MTYEKKKKNEYSIRWINLALLLLITSVLTILIHVMIPTIPFNTIFYIHISLLIIGIIFLLIGHNKEKLPFCYQVGGYFLFTAMAFGFSNLPGIWGFVGGGIWVAASIFLIYLWRKED